MRAVIDAAKFNHAAWMRGAQEPLNWQNRFDIPKQNWPERRHFYERDLAIQQDMEFLSEAVFTFYQDHLGKIRAR